MKPLLPAGQRRHQVQLQQQTLSANADGEMVPTWTTIATLRARVLSLGGSEPVIAGGAQALQAYEVNHRYFASLDETMRYSWVDKGGLLLEIVGITPDDRMIEQVVHCLAVAGVSGTAPGPSGLVPGYWGSGYWSA